MEPVALHWWHPSFVNVLQHSMGIHVKLVRVLFTVFPFRWNKIFHCVFLLYHLWYGYPIKFFAACVNNSYSDVWSGPSGWTAGNPTHNNAFTQVMICMEMSGAQITSEGKVRHRPNWNEYCHVYWFEIVCYSKLVHSDLQAHAKLCCPLSITGKLLPAK